MIKEYLKVTDDLKEIYRIAERLTGDITINIRGEKKTFYTPLMLSKMDQEIARHAGEISKEEKEALRYQFIYDYWVYGCTVDEEYYLQLKDKTGAEKSEYMVRQLRNIYVQHLNWDAGPDRVAKLEDKYRLYKALKPYFMRDIIEINSIDDYDVFSDFVSKHHEFVVKPADTSHGIGVHKASMDDYSNDCKAAMEQILGEGEAIHAKHPSKGSQMVLEELIEQDETLTMLHPASINPIRATAVKDKNGRICLYRPRIKIGLNGSFVGSGAQNSFLLEIDPETGKIRSDGYQENGEVFAVHPNTGIVFKGFQIPKWQELIELVNTLMDKLPEYRYIGWDLALTPDGWCVVEGNYSGEFGSQMILGRGLKKEFEELIGWKYDKEYWWESNERFAHN